MSKARIAILEEELARVQDRIDRAYWAFTRLAKAKPPALAVPDAYKRRAELRLELSEERSALNDD